MKTQTPQSEGSLTSYTIGFVLSIILTVAAYVLVLHHLLTGNLLIATIAGLALLQLMVQLLFFLHLNQVKSRWNAIIFWFMVLIVAIFVFGSLWIMKNLNYNMTPAQINAYMNSQDSL